MLIDRTIVTTIKKILSREPKIIVIYGPRQTGKTVLLTELVKNEDRKTRVFNGDDLLTQEIFSAPILSKLEQIAGDNEILVFDEAQRIENIGQSLKLLFDNHPRFILASGSSSFDLADKLAEAMTGRATYLTLYPLSVTELPQEELRFGLDKKIEELMIFGMYPKIHTLGSQEEKEQYLLDIVNTYLYKDLLMLEGVRKPKKIIDLLQLLAFQVGSLVSIQELSQNLQLAHVVVEKYLDVLEKMFIIINLRGLSRNLRKEIYKTSKYYFIDLGLRNALLRNFNPLKRRNDAGQLFENFCFIERLKFLGNNRKFANHYFWRTYDQKEIDLIEERNGKLTAFEFKYGLGKVPPATKKEFLKTYPGSEFKIITPENLEEFII